MRRLSDYWLSNQTELMKLLTVLGSKPKQLVWLQGESDAETAALRLIHPLSALERNPNEEEALNEPECMSLVHACGLSHSVLSASLQSARLLCPWDSPGRDTGVGCHFLLQGIFLTQGSNSLLCLLAGGFFTSESPGKP